MSEAGIIVFICKFAGGKEGSLDIPILQDYASRLPGVHRAEIIDQACKPLGMEQIAQALRSSGSDRFVVAACSPLVREKRIGRVARESGLNPYMVSFANLREQCAFVHGPNEANSKAKRLLRMAVAHCASLRPAPFGEREIKSQTVLVLGDGVRAALVLNELSRLPFDVRCMAPDGRLKMPLLVDALIVAALGSGSGAGAVTAGTLVKLEGVPGSFTVTNEQDGATQQTDCGAVIVAFDPVGFAPMEGRVGTLELARALAGQRRIPRQVVLVVGDWRSPQPTGMQMEAALNAAIELKNRSPLSEVAVVAQEVMTPGSLEAKQLLAQKLGVLFFRSDEAPRTRPIGTTNLVFKDQVLGEIAIAADMVVDFSYAPNERSSRTCEALHIGARPDGLPLESRVRLHPAASIREGVFVVDPWNEGCSADMLADCRAVVARVEELLHAPNTEFGGSVASVTKEKCSACLECVRICPYGAPLIADAGKAIISEELCQGCGMCVSLCPSKAIDMHVFSDSAMIVQGDAALKGADE